MCEVLEQLSQQCHLNEDCREAFHLLQKPHLQVSILEIHPSIFLAIFFSFIIIIINDVLHPVDGDPFQPLQSLLYAHDAIAQKDFYPHLPDLPVEMDEDEETIKIVQLVKSNEPLVSSISKRGFCKKKL